MLHLSYMLSSGCSFFCTNNPLAETTIVSFQLLLAVKALISIASVDRLDLYSRSQPGPFFFSFGGYITLAAADLVSCSPLEGLATWVSEVCC
jgi:hypothetical protein